MSEPPANPFAAPAADTAVAVQRTIRPGFLWRPYCWILIPVMAYHLLFGTRALTPADYVYFPVFTVSAAGLVGFVYRRRLLSPRFWAAWLPVQIITDVVMSAMWAADNWSWLLANIRTLPGISGTVVGLAFLLLLYLALYRYAHHSHELWHPPVAGSGPAAP
jgi:hypothetical protein